jgi:hypothetical protein
MVTTLGSLVHAQKPADFDKQVSNALDRSRPLLLTKLKTLEQGRLALACHALLNDGVTIQEPRLATAILRLSKTVLHHGYALSLRLMVIQELRSYPDRREAAGRDCKELLKRQTGSGGFSYNSASGNGDLSNTQYAALGLRAAHNLGVQIPQKRWDRLASYALRQQGGNGGGHYSKKRRKASASMTVALIAVLEICKPRLKARGSLQRKSQKGIAKAWEWVQKNPGFFGAAKNPSMHSYYCHYGLERAGILSTVFEIDGVDWYAAGARMMIEHQAEAGGWSSLPRRTRGRARGLPPAAIDPVITSFAILFLRRRFQRSLTTATTSGSQIRALYLPENATKQAIEASVKGEVARGYKAVPGLIKALRSQFVSRRRAAAKALIEITGRFEELSPYRKPAENAELLDSIEAWWMREGRKKLDK